MNLDRLQGNWEVLKGKIQKQWGKLTEDDLAVIEGNRKELLGRLQTRYGYEKDRAQKELENWLSQV